jgi:uncharacterized protein (TIGR00369 family)
VTRPVTRADLEAMLGGIRVSRDFGFRLREFGDGDCTIDVPYREELDRPGGVVSGPVFMAAADAATWLAVATRVGEATWVTVDLKTAFLRAARREDFSCRARVPKVGRQSIYGVAECVRADGTLLTHHTVTYARLP